MRTTFLYICISCMVLENCDHAPDKKIIFTVNAPAPIGPYSQAVLNEGTLYVSGQIGLRPDGLMDTTSLENECRQVLNNVKAIVEAAGMHLSDVSKATVYLTDLNNFAKMNAVYKTFFSEFPPARETLQVKALPKGAHIEISVIAVRSFQHHE